MLFNSYVFILLFLPMTVCGYFLLNRFGKQRAASAYLLLASLFFYAYFNPAYLPLILLSVSVNYAVYLGLRRAHGKAARRLLVTAGIAFDLGILFYYKYFDFFSENINALFSADLPLRSLILPLGISFFTFQQISFILDAYKGEVPEYSPVDYALFVSFFPQLIAGPIVTHSELVPQLRDESKRTLDWDNLARGTYLFILGLAKKVLLADVFGQAVNYGFSSIRTLGGADAIAVMLAYTLQIYFDFSGYCDMASGAAKMLNIDLPENFNSPYRARSVIEFWRRWHMTLTRFFQRYIYHPLGGSKKGALRTSANVMLVFFVSGLWHGAAWTFVIWGLCHGVASVLERLCEPAVKRIPKVIGAALTFSFVALTWVLFRAENVSDAVLFFERLFSGGGLSFSREIIKPFAQSELVLLFTTLLRFNPYTKFPPSLMLGYFAVALVIVFAAPKARASAERFTPSLPRLAISCLLLVWCVFSLSGVSTFLYFNF